MLLSCPNCGNVTKIADVLIPSARLTATCSGCGAKIGGTVPARLAEGKPGGDRKRAPRGGGAGAGAKRKTKPPEAKSQKKNRAPTGEADRPSLGPVAKGLDAERLAGLIASDMLLYNRGKIQKNGAQGRLLSSMATEIVEAWEFYKKRVGGHTALGTSYFRDALNNVLSDGDPII